MEISMGLGEIMIEGKKIEQFRTIEEMDVVEGKVVSFHLCPLADLILKRDSLSVSMVMRMKEYVETISFSSLKRIVTKEFLTKLKKVKKINKTKTDLVKSLKSLLFSILYRGAVHSSVSVYHPFFDVFSITTLFSQIKEESKRILEEGEIKGIEQEKEKEEIVLSYGFLQKGRKIRRHESLQEKMNKYLMGILDEVGNDEKCLMKKMKASLCLRGLCGGFNFHFLYFLSFSELSLFFF
jgi:hypothetical protein